ncbi:transforming growth factor-beta-induced protein ig-h3-like [Centruroides sculpturatus]|uniref:transforming growth factor-beta-induced protein ig-h3-like n=2 Tax=Centruroides sculpturatus TaxID=218467 RepID=UPI000C6E9DC7|nr:transforming growth factor-beta-induced protein ig-h3-like [Centruroides sculpturatus]
MINGHLILNNIENDQMIRTLNNTFLRFNSYYGGDVKTVSGAQVINAENNGAILVYIIDRTLGRTTDQNIIDYLSKNHVKFYELLQLTNFIQNIAEGTYTIFAPSDESFFSLPNSALNLLNHNQTLLQDVLQNHIIESTIYTPALTKGSLLTTVGGSALTISTRRGIILVNGVSIVKPDIQVTNGVVHVINRLILPKVFLELCRCMPMNSDTSLRGRQRELSVSTPERDRHSVVVISPRGSHLPRSSVIIIKPSNSRPSEFGSRINSTSGIHYIFPTTSPVSSQRTSKTVLQVLETPIVIAGRHPAKFTIVTNLLRKAGLMEVLSQTNPLTTLLPTDEAFEKLPENKLQQMQNDVQLLKRVLLCHMVARNIPVNDLQNNYRLQTYNGVPVVVNILKRRRMILINGAEVLATSPVVNGFVYIINRIFYPLPAPNILNDLKKRPEVTRFLDLVRQANLENLLSGINVATVFVPTNKAFQNIPEEVLKEIFKDTYSLQELILRHVVSGIHYSIEFDSDSNLESRLGEALNFVKTPEGIYVNGVRIIQPDITSGNGVIHLLDSVISKQDVTYGPIDESEFETTTSPSTTLSSTISETEVTTIPSSSDFTERYSSPTSVITTLAATTSEETTTTHEETTTTPKETTTVPVETTTTPVETTSASEETTSASEETTSASEETTTALLSTETIESSSVSTTDLPTTTLPSVLDATMGQGIDEFIGLLNQSGYLDSFQDGNEYTIFVPTDEALNSLPPTLRSTLKKQPKKLQKTLKHHIVPSLVDPDHIPNDMTLPTLLPNKNIRINKYEDATTASGAKIVKPPIRVGNVQIVPVNQVLVPPVGDLHRTVTKSPLMKQFSKLIEISGLEDEIKQGGPYTLFAPSKKAFKKMSSEEYNRLITDPNLAKEFVLRHLVRGTHYTNGIKDGSTLTSENGHELKLMNKPDCLGVNGVNFSFSDINTTNGVIHVIDDVL